MDGYIKLYKTYHYNETKASAGFKWWLSGNFWKFPWWNRRSQWNDSAYAGRNQPSDKTDLSRRKCKAWTTASFSAKSDYATFYLQYSQPFEMDGCNTAGRLSGWSLRFLLRHSFLLYEKYGLFHRITGRNNFSYQLYKNYEFENAEWSTSTFWNTGSTKKDKDFKIFNTANYWKCISSCFSRCRTRMFACYYR